MLKEKVLRSWKTCKEKIKKRTLTKEEMTFLESLADNYVGYTGIVESYNQLAKIKD